MQQLQGIVRNLTNENFAVNAVTEHIVIETKRRKGGSCCAKAPVRPFAEAVLVGVRMADESKVVAKVGKQVIRDMKMPPSAGVTDGPEVFDATQL